jgi:dTDP-4-dehydrorhamnose 3,5-epimerase
MELKNSRESLDSIHKKISLMSKNAIDSIEVVLGGVEIITGKRFEDDRGFFQESFNKISFAYNDLPGSFVQDNHSRSKRGVIRGMHFQYMFGMGKLIRVVRGEILLVELDLRRGSPTFGKHVKIHLNDNEPKMVWIPSGFANGFQVLSDVADVCYKCDENRFHEKERSIRWDSFDCDWKDLGIDPILSEKDANAISFDDWCESDESRNREWYKV